MLFRPSQYSDEEDAMGQDNVTFRRIGFDCASNEEVEQPLFVDKGSLKRHES